VIDGHNGEWQQAIRENLPAALGMSPLALKATRNRTRESSPCQIVNSPFLPKVGHLSAKLMPTFGKNGELTISAKILVKIVNSPFLPRVGHLSAKLIPTFGKNGELTISGKILVKIVNSQFLLTVGHLSAKLVPTFGKNGELTISVKIVNSPFLPNVGTNFAHKWRSLVVDVVR
jgi:hypothetical protein